MVVIVATAGVGSVLLLVGHNPFAGTAVVAASLLEMGTTIVRYVHPSARTTEGSIPTRPRYRFAALTSILCFVVFAPGRVTSYRVLGAVAIYLNIALVFAAIYRLIDVLAPGAFSPLTRRGDMQPGFTLIYFSFQVLTTLGFGDVIPPKNGTRFASAAGHQDLRGRRTPARSATRSRPRYRSRRIGDRSSEREADREHR